MQNVMKLRQALFWDTNPDKIDPEGNAQYIIERVLDFGNDGEVKWLYHFYDTSRIKDVVTKSRSLMPKTKNLWTLLLENK